MFDKLKTLQSDQRGSSLLMSMLLMLVIAGLGFILASIMIREINLSRTFDNSLASYYAAESGIERSLDIVGENRINSETLSDTMTGIENYTSSSAIELSNGAEYEIETTLTTSTVESVVSSVPIANGTQIDFYDPDNSISSTMNAESVEFEWNEPDSATCSHPSPRLEVTFIEYDSTTAFGTDDVVDKYIYTCTGTSAEYDCLVTSNVPSSGANYIVRLKALDCAIPLLETIFYQRPNGSSWSGPGNQSEVEVPSVITLAAQGDGGATKRIITAQTKWNPGGTGFIDFVLFSLEEISR